MATKGFTRKFKPLKILTEEQVEAIHRGTIDVLWETGVRVEHGRALKLFKKNYCKVDFEEKRVRIPPGLVEECLRKAPSVFRIKARDPKNDLIIGGNTVYFTNFPGMQIVDPDTWESRIATRKEYYDLITVLDALPNLHLLSCYPYFGFEGLPEVMKIPEGVAAKIRNTTKIQLLCYSKDCEIFNIKMVKAIKGMEAIGATHAAPPLTYNPDMIESLFRYIEAGFPIWIGSGDVMGGTSPATIAGSVITTNAEMMADIVLIQLIKPGTRVIVHDYTFPQNMRTGSPAFGAIETSLHQTIFSQIWRRHGVPSLAAAAGITSSKKIDFQCGYEKAIAALTAALSGANLIQFHSGVYGELTAHPLQSILDDDIAGMIGRFIEGVEVNDETLAIDLIEEVGPIPGHYLNKEHTRKWWKKEQFIPKSADRLTYPEWMKIGKKSCLDYAKEKMEEILATHKPMSLTENQDKEIEKILEEAGKYYKEKGMT